MSADATLLAPSSADWASTLAVIPHDAYHLPGYVAMEARSIGGAPVAFRYGERGTFFFLPMILREIEGTAWIDAVSPYGYPGVASNADVADEGYWTRACTALVAELRRISAITCFVRMNALLRYPERVLQRSGSVIQHGHTVALDLTLTQDEMWAQTRSNHRRQIKRTHELGMNLVVDDWERLDQFVALYLETMRRVGASEFYLFGRSYVEDLRAALGRDVHLMLIASADGIVVCGGIFLDAPAIVQYHLGGTRNDALHLGPAKQLFDDVRNWSKARGNVVLHLGGGTHPGSSPLFHFKAGFSEWHPPLHTWRIVTNRSAYAALTAEFKPEADTSDDAQFFPAYRSRAHASRQ